MSGNYSLIRRTLFIPKHARSTRRGIVTTRQFSSSYSRHDEDSKTSASPRTHKVINSEGSAIESRPQSTSRRPLTRGIDARSLGAPRQGNDSKILRAPALLRSKPAQMTRGRRPGTAAGTVKSKARASEQKIRKKRSPKISDDSRDEAAVEVEIEDVLYEQERKERPQPARYDPVQYDFANLKETWPSIPIGRTGQASSVYEKLALMSDRYANGYYAPHDLAQKLYKGEHVFFESEKEKEQVLEEARKLAQDRADKLAQRKGDTVDPEDVSFKAVTEDTQKELIAQFVSGKYTILDSTGEGKLPVVNEVLRNLANNETYRTTGKQGQFLTKLESLLTPPQRAKRG